MLTHSLRAGLLSLLLTSAAAQDNLFPGALRTTGHLPQVSYAQRTQVATQWTRLNGALPGTSGAPDQIKIVGVSAGSTHPLCINPARAYQKGLNLGRATYTLSEYGVIEQRTDTCMLILPTLHLEGVTLTAAGETLRIQTGGPNPAAWLFDPVTRTLTLSRALTTRAAPAAAPDASTPTDVLSANFAARIDRSLTPLPTRSTQSTPEMDTRAVTGRDCREGSRELSGRPWNQGPDSYAQAITAAIAAGQTDFTVLSSDWARERPSGAVAFSRLLWYMTLLDRTSGDQLFIRILSAGDVIAVDACRLT